MKTFGFPAQEKLKKKKDIDLLFSKGKWLSVDNVRIITLKSSEKSPIESGRLGVSVSKKFFKRAVDRNRIKRLLRESYRLNKELYRTAFGNNSYSMLFWVSKELPTGFAEVETHFKNLCQKKIS